MPKLVSPLWADTPTACAITGFCRQRLHELQKTSGFPLPIKIGRSTRYAVDAITEWMRQMSKGGTPASTPLVAVNENVRASKPKKTPLSAETEPVAGGGCTLSLSVEKPKKHASKTGIEISTRQVLRVTTHSTQSHFINLAITKKVQYAPGVREAIEAHEAEEKKLRALLAQSQQIASTTDSKKLDGERDAAGTCDKPPFSPERMKHDYESGMTLDALCKRYSMGKARISQKLKEAGTAMRRPGRQLRQTVPV